MSKNTISNQLGEVPAARRATTQAQREHSLRSAKRAPINVGPINCMCAESQRRGICAEG